MTRTVDDALAYAARYWTNPDDPITDRVWGKVLADEVVRLCIERDELRAIVQSGSFTDDGFARQVAMLPQRMAHYMMRKLRTNSHKGNEAAWRADGYEVLLRRVREEVYELEDAVRTGTGGIDPVWNEAADVANTAGMIADKYEYERTGRPDVCEAAEAAAKGGV